MQVRYQAAPRSDSILILGRLKTRRGTSRAGSANDTPFPLASQDAQQLLELEPHLLYDLLTLADIAARLFAG